MNLESTHGGFAGRSLVNVMQETLDKTFVEFDENRSDDNASYEEELKLQGMIAGMAKMIGIIRGTSVKTEVEESRRRGYERSKSGEELTEMVTDPHQ